MTSSPTLCYDSHYNDSSSRFQMKSRLLMREARATLWRSAISTNLGRAVQTNLTAACRPGYEVPCNTGHHLSSCTTEKAACGIQEWRSPVLRRVITVIKSCNWFWFILFENYRGFLTREQCICVVTFFRIHLFRVLRWWISTRMLCGYHRSG